MCQTISWAQFRKYFGLYNFSLFCPIASNHLFKPSIQDSVFQDWHRTGIEHFNYLFIDNTLASFEQNEKCTPSISNFIRYIKARQYVLSNMSTLSIPTDATIVDLVLSLDPSCKRLISVLYCIVMGLRHIPMDRLRALWDKDLGLSKSDDTWTSIPSTSLCARDCLILFKVVHSGKWKVVHFPKTRPICTPGLAPIVI